MIMTGAFIRFQYILTCWHESLICSPLEVTSVLRYLLLICFHLCSFSQPAAQVQAVFFGPMQPDNKPKALTGYVIEDTKQQSLF